jgi:predicted DNA-binding protein
MYDTDAPHTDPLTGLVIRIPAGDYGSLKTLSERTRIRQSEFLREAIADLLDKYAHLL